jgi:DNA polymerase III alpha subunit
LRSSEERAAIYEYPGAITNTSLIAEKCDVDLTIGKTLLPKFTSTRQQRRVYLLRELVETRAPQRIQL